MVWSIMSVLCSTMLFKSNIEIVMMMLTSIILISKSYFLSSQHEMGFFFMDWLSMSMFHLSILLTCLTVTVSSYKNDKNKVLMCLSSGLIALLFFLSSNLLAMFISFEMSLVPLMLMIMGWGKQPERIVAGKFMMFYTLISSFPLMCSVIFFEEIKGLFSIIDSMMFLNQSCSWPTSISTFLYLSIFLSFCTKIPMFFLHSWLPKAHVEAPLEGSIILAGIMLKVGVFGIIRLISTFPFPNFFYTKLMLILFSISLVGSVISAIMAVSSDDMKTSIALSSVSHMNFLLCGIVSSKELSLYFSNFTMICHGMISSMLFYFVTMIYEMFNSRSMLMVKGSMSKKPSILLFTFIMFSLSISIPPSLPFYSEMITLSSVWSFSKECFPIACTFIMSNSFLSMTMYGMLNHSSNSKNMSYNSLDTPFNMMSLIYSVTLVTMFFFSESTL